MRESFIIYRSFFEAIKDLELEQQAVVFNAICEYSLNGTEVELNGVCSTVFKLIKPQLQANNNRYKSGCYGAKIKQEQSKSKAKRKQTRSKVKANVNVNDNVNVNVNDNVNPNENDVRDYFVSNGYSFEAATKFYNYYSVAGWRDGKGNKVKNWKQKAQAVWFKPENKLQPASKLPTDFAV